MSDNLGNDINKTPAVGGGESPTGGHSSNTSSKHSFKDDFRSRVAQTKTTRWIRFGIVAAIFIAWVIWMGNPWLALILILLFDIYITGYIPFTWWKKSKNSFVRGVMSWVDAIVYALILVYFIFNFVGQNYQIPSPSLEKTLLTGDYLWVNKLAYGPRVPMTPVHFPLVHNTMPIINTDSYLDSPSLEYRRLKGYKKIQRGDIVVFNFPAGDTVASGAPQGADYYTLQKVYGKEVVANNPEHFGKLIYRPVDRRENYVKRLVGMPGDNFKIVNDTIVINGEAQPFPHNVQFRYIAAFNRPLEPELAHKLGINLDDVAQGQMPMNFIQGLKEFNAIPELGNGVMYYNIPLSSDIIAQAKEMGALAWCGKWNDIQKMVPLQEQPSLLYPDIAGQKWSVSNYGGQDGIIIPSKGMTVELNPQTWDLYHRVIRNYEGHFDAYLNHNGQVIINGKPARDYTFAMDYYFMMGDNRDNSQDSRFWGFVPEDHIVGTPMRVLISFDKDRNLFNGGIRWNRVFKDANPDD